MLNHAILYPRNTLSRRRVSMDGMWKFWLDWESRGEEKGWTSGIPGEEYIPVPASFQDFYTRKEVREYTGDFWYETDVFVPQEWKGKRVLIRFGAATHRAAVYVNGEPAAEHEGGFLPFCADITTIARYGADNRVVVKVNNELNETNIPCGSTVTLPDGKKMAKQYFDFFNYAGLQRSVCLIAVPEEAVYDLDLSYQLLGKDAKVAYAVKTTGEHDVRVQLFDRAGRRVAEAEGRQGELYVEDARLWKVRDAYLYKLCIQIMDGGEIIDAYEQEIGIRTVEIRGTDILLNGEPVYLKGFGKHEDSDIVGRGFHAGMMKRDFELMKWIGANSFRTSHYPYAEEIYQMADREGFLVIDEAPAVGLFESLQNFMDASSGKKTAFFAKETTPVLLKAHLKAVEEMIQRDKNHPCVIAWSLLNEPETTDETAVPYFKAVFEKAHELDVQKRPRTFAMVQNSLPETCKCYQFSDLIALNRYYGWYVAGGYEISQAEILFRREMDAWRDKNLDKPFIFTEYGADTMAAEHKLPSVMWSQEYQQELLEMMHRVFDSYAFVKGEQIWNFADFQTSEGLMRVNGNKKGVFTRQRQPKAAAFLLKKRWEELPLAGKR